MPASSTSVKSFDCDADAEIASYNAARDALIVYNDSTAADLYVRFGDGAVTATDFSVKLASGEYLVLESTDYQGSLHAIWSAADAGKVRVTELV